MKRSEHCKLSSSFAVVRNGRYGAHRGRKGNMLFIMMIALLVMSGLVFFVFNLGGQLNAKMEMQNASDAAASGGGAWLARSMNIIANNNIMQARLLASIPVIDAMPLAAETALYEISVEVDSDSLFKGMNNQVNGENGKEKVPVSRMERSAKTVKPWALAKTVADAVLFLPTDAVVGGIPEHYTTDRRGYDQKTFKINRDWWENLKAPATSKNPSLDAINSAISMAGIVNDTPELTGMWKAMTSPPNAYGGGCSECVETVNWDSYPQSPASSRAKTSSAQWKSVVQAGDYYVYVWCCSDDDGKHRDNDAAYVVETSADGQAWVNVASKKLNQNIYTGWWRSLGKISLQGKSEVRVVLTPKLTSEPNAGDLSSDSFIVEGLKKLRDELEKATEESSDGSTSQVEMLKELDTALDSADEGPKSDIPTYGTEKCADFRGEEGGDAYRLDRSTYWHPPNGDGQQGDLWKAMKGLEELSEATVDATPVLVQNNANKFAQNSKASTGVIAPVIPKLPVKWGEFSDFYPILNGSLTMNENLQTGDVTVSGASPIYGIIEGINAIDKQMENLKSEMDTLADEWKVLYDKIVALEPTFDFKDPVIDSGYSAELQSLITQWIDVDDRLCNKENEYRRREDQKLRAFYTIHQRCLGGYTPDATLGTYSNEDEELTPYRLGPFFNMFDGFRRWPGYPYAYRYYHGGIRREWAFGPYAWALERVWRTMGWPGSHWGEGLSDVTRFSSYVTLIANIKMAYLYHKLDNQQQKIRYGHRWITDYDRAKAYIAQEGDKQFEAHKKGEYYISKILLTRYYRVTVHSSIPQDDPAWLCDSATYHVPQGNGTVWPQDEAPSSWTWEPKYWYDIEARLSGTPNAAIYPEWKLERLCKDVWRVQAVRYNDGTQAPHYGRYRTNEFRYTNTYLRLKSEGKFSTDDQSIPWRRYETRWYVFGGLEIYEDLRVVNNPFNWATTPSNPPRPMLIDADPDAGISGDYGPYEDEGWRREKFTFLAAALRKYDAPLWSGKFKTGNPADKILTVSQFSLFNNKSWDLWTPAWQSQLVPINDWKSWAAAFADGEGDVADLEGVIGVSDYQEISDYVQKLDPGSNNLEYKH